MRGVFSLFIDPRISLQVFAIRAISGDLRHKICVYRYTCWLKDFASGEIGLCGNIIYLVLIEHEGYHRLEFLPRNQLESIAKIDLKSYVFYVCDLVPQNFLLQTGLFDILLKKGTKTIV